MDTENNRTPSHTPNFIRGIFNYCDRWCERCPFTDRCRCYASLENRGLNDPTRFDLNQPEFWEHLRQIFQAAKERLHQIATQEGINLNNPELTKESLKHELEVDELADQHLLLILQAQAYAIHAARLLDESDLSEELETVLRRKTHGSPNLQHDSAKEILDALEVISYYHTFIYVKLGRAVYSWAEEQLEPAWMEDLSRDSDGSAKVALIAIDRSWQAWATLRRHVDQGEESMVESLRQLSDLRGATERTFPAAWGFFRAGFDDL